MNSKVIGIETQLRDAILSSGTSRYEIAKQAGVTNSQLSLFLSGQRSLTLTSAAKIAHVLDLELAKRNRKRKAR